MKISCATFFGIFFYSAILFFPLHSVFAQTESTQVQPLNGSAEIFFSPRSGTFTEGSTFSVPLLLDTQGGSINSMEIVVRFDPRKLSVVNPSGGKSVIGLWIEPPSFDNTRGIVKFVGVIPGGISASSGLVATITFRAHETGQTNLSISSESRVLLNDGYGTEADATFGRASYSIVAKPSEGLTINSETHPLSDRWYNNTSPSFSWEKLEGSDGYSYVLDASPSTIPSDSVITSDNRIGFESLKDGVWYFHLKAKKGGIWGNTSHYIVKIDTAAPAAFTPAVDYLTATDSLYRGQVTFKTTDALSGIDHYEVGAIDVLEDTASPIYVQAESPYQVSAQATTMRVYVRAFDAAGNVRDATVEVDLNSFMAILMRNMVSIALGAILVTLLALIGIHYLIRHHVLHHFKDAYRLFRKEQIDETEHEHTLPPTNE